MSFLRSVILAAVLCLPFVGAAQDEPAPEVSLDAEGPVQLLERGRRAYAESNFAEAEQALEKFITDYGEAEEAKEAARIHTPLVALCKVKLEKFDEALEWIARSLQDTELDRLLRDELSFWKGICLMTRGDYVEAQKSFGEYFANPDHQPFKRYESLILFASLYLVQGFPEAAGDMLEHVVPKIRERAPEAASRAVVLQLYARIEAGQREKALELIRVEFPNLPDMTQIVSFQMLAMKLGSDYLAEKDWYNSILCLQRILPRARVLEIQSAKLKQIEDRMAEVEGRANAQSIMFQLNAIKRRVERELESFRAIENFDSAMRLRLATAFQGLERYREAALIMEDMLASMDPDPVVESATLAQIQCWMEIGRWTKAVEAADRYIAAFGNGGKSLAMVFFLKAEAQRELFEFGEAQLTYGKLVESFPDHDLSPKAMFLQGFMYLQQDDNEGALYQFDQVKRAYPDAAIVDDADYWSGMAYSFSKMYGEAREHMQGYLEKYDRPKYRKEAIFRIAVCTFSLAEYEESIRLFEEFVAAYPGDSLTDEAHLLLGDAYLGLGERDKGFAAYDAVRPEATRFFEDAFLKKGKAFKLLEEFDNMREHYQAFIDGYPESNRLPEAVYWVGWIHLNAEEPAKAQETYWSVIDEHGNNPDMFPMSDVFAALPKVYQDRGDAGRDELLSKLELMKIRAAGEDEKTRGLRAAWTKAQILGRTSPEAARAELLSASTSGLVDPKRQNPLLTVAVGEALLSAGNLTTAKELLTEIRRWHPRAIQKDRIFAALGEIAEKEGDAEKAVEYHERFEREAATSLQLAEVQMRKAALLAEAGDTGRARATYEAILENANVSASMKAKTLFELGMSHLASDEPKRAIVYFERVYVAYGKFSELNARAYWERARALEDLGLEREALETYRELVSREDLEGLEEVERAGEEIARLEPLVPDEPAVPVEGEPGKTTEPEETS